MDSRAAAEAEKSECFRFAAQLGDYAGSKAQSAFVERRNAFAEPAERAGLTPVADPIPKEGYPQCPPIPIPVGNLIRLVREAESRNASVL
jgi:hypothetical protein